ncbi:phage tail tape measure protein [Pikeienuella sp. HZG-20]|uniref:phage tail tape measure protein n=1 Tax=Paludibacillus litoralis TaxID=3133267 RepID=UPI0030EE7880
MASVIGSLRANLGLDSAQFEKGLDRSTRRMKGFSRDADRLGRSIGVALRGLLPALGAAAFVRAADRALTSLDNIGKTAAKLGLTTDALQELRSAGEQSGVAMGTVDMALQRFVRRVEEARNGTGEAKGALEEMGIALNDASGAARPTEDILNDVADAMAGMDTEGAKLRVAFKLFDSEGAALVNTLGEGSGALDGMRRRARDLGSVIGGDVIANAEDLRTEIDLLVSAVGARLTGAFGRAAVALNGLFSVGAERRLAEVRRQIASVQEQAQREMDRVMSGAAVNPLADDPFDRIERAQRALARLREEAQSLESQIKPPEPPVIPGGGSDGDGDGDGAKKNKAEYDDLILSIHEKNLATRDELKLVGLTGAAHDRRALSLEADRLQLDLVAAAQKDGLPLDRARVAAINEAVGAYEALRAELISAVEAEDLHQESLRETAAAAARSKAAIEQIGDALTSAVTSANSFEDALKNVALQLINIAGQGLAGAGPLGGALGGVIPSLFSSAPATSPTPIPRPFARGGIVDGPTVFPMARGLGLMGEAGAEAIMPLKRGPGGRLGVEASGGGGGVSVTLNVDARGSNDPAAIEAAVTQSSAMILSAVPEAVRQALRHGGL